MTGRAAIRVLHVVGGYPDADRPHRQVFLKTQVVALAGTGVEVEVLSLKGRGLLKYASGWSQVKARLTGAQLDLLHSHYAYCGLVCLNHGLPLVASFLGSDLAGYARRDGSYSGLSRWAHRGLARFVATQADACIVKSQRMRDVLGMDVHVIPNGVDMVQFQPAPADMRARVREELSMAPDVRYVIFAADPLLPHKRFALAKAAVAEASQRVDWPLELIPVAGVPQTDVVRYMQAGDILIMTSSQEGSPNVVKEAMAVGMAIVAVDVGDTKERLEGVSGCRVTADERPEAIGAALADVLLSDEPREGRCAIEQLSAEAMARRIRALYEGLLSKA